MAMVLMIVRPKLEMGRVAFVAGLGSAVARLIFVSYRILLRSRRPHRSRRRSSNRSRGCSNSFPARSLKSSMPDMPSSWTSSTRQSNCGCFGIDAPCARGGPLSLRGSSQRLATSAGSVNGRRIFKEHVPREHWTGGFRISSGCILSLVVSGAFAQSPTPSPTPATAASPSRSRTRDCDRLEHSNSNWRIGANPVQVIDRYTIEKSGERNTEELLRNQPVANANGVPTSGNAGAIYGQGASSISLRGFDPGATLVLIDGHRMVSHPSGTSGGLEFFVDLNTIPQAAIESVEILKDGASTTYGADAVAGVVNIKLRHNYQGAEAYAEYGNSTDTDSGETAASILFGVGDNNTHLTGVANYYSRNSIFSRDRDYDRRTSLPTYCNT